MDPWIKRPDSGLARLGRTRHAKHRAGYGGSRWRTGTVIHEERRHVSELRVSLLTISDGNEKSARVRQRECGAKS